MIKIEANSKQHTIKCEICGSLTDITAEMCVIIQKVYNGIYNDDKEAADIFKGFITQSANNGDLFEIENDAPEQKSKDNPLEALKALLDIINIKGEKK